MSRHIGEIGKRITAEVTIRNIYEYQTTFGWQTQDHYIYTMEDADGNILVWKTTKFMGFWDYEKQIGFAYKRGDKIEITGTVKAHSEYKDTPQTEIQRCKYKIIERTPTKEELEAKKRSEQLASIGDGDFIWKMPYGQYKEHYSDCETIAGSFQTHRNRPATIDVIIRKGRLKNSGTRGRFFSWYSLIDKDNNTLAYKAISEENALSRAAKEHPESIWECYQIMPCDSFRGYH